MSTRCPSGHFGAREHVAPGHPLDHLELISSVVSLAVTLPSALTGAGITGTAADELAASTRQSAGTVIAQLRGEGSSAAAVDALAQGFADATRWSLIVASVFLLLGVVGAARLRRVAERS